LLQAAPALCRRSLLPFRRKARVARSLLALLSAAHPDQFSTVG
jgi:hypothetical protein